MIDNFALASRRPQTTSKEPPGHAKRKVISGMHTELLSDCDRIARIWRDRCQADAALWSALADELAGTSTLTDALAIYSNCAGERMRMVTENARRLFEEYQTMMQKYAAAEDGKH